MKELGAYLKEQRIATGVGAEEAASDLEITLDDIENIESGNVKAFKDIYELKESVRAYAKYLGLKNDKVMEEFNNFIFQHTSRISLEDIQAAQKRKEEAEQKKVKSPYTKEYKEKINLWPLVYILVGVIVLFVVVYIIVNSINRAPKRINELKLREEVVYEYAN